MRKYELTINDQSFTVVVKRFSPQAAELEVNGAAYDVRIDNIEMDTAGLPPPRSAPARAPARGGASAPSAAPPKAAPTGGGAASQEGQVTAPIPGLVMEVFVKEGDAVKNGQPLLKMEAMKMENVVQSATAGSVVTISVNAGDVVTQGQELMVIN